MSDPLLKKNVDCELSKVQELNDLKEFLKVLKNKASRYKILYDVLQDTTASDAMDPKLKSKLQEIYLGESCTQTINLDDGLNKKSNALLGLTNLSSESLTFNESSRLKKVLEFALEDKYKSICDEFYKLTGVSVNSVSSVSGFGELCSDDHVLLDLKTKLEEQQKLYFQNLLDEQKILEDLVKLKLEGLPDKCNSKLKECEAKSKLCALQCKIVDHKTRFQIFMETSHSLEAYQELIKDIEEQKEECQREIQYLEKQKEKYHQVSCKEFDDMLKTYLQYKTLIEKKKMIYEILYGRKEL